jgi:hypothetical protein
VAPIPRRLPPENALSTKVATTIGASRRSRSVSSRAAGARTLAEGPISRPAPAPAVNATTSRVPSGIPKYQRTMLFIAPRMVPYFNAVWGVKRAGEATRFSRPARAILRVLRREWEMASSDLREDAGVGDRAAFTRALDELQAAMIVIPAEVYYKPKFTYIWTLAVGRFPDALRRRVAYDTALREIARAFLSGAGLTVRGELARVTGLSRRDAGLGNRALVAEGFATMEAPGVYRLAGIVDVAILPRHALR